MTEPPTPKSEETSLGRAEDATDPAGLEAFLDALKRKDSSAAVAVVDAHPALVAGRDATGVPTLLLAAYFRADDVCSHLISKGAKADACTAAALGLVEPLAAALKSDRKALGTHSADGWTPLHLAAFFGRDETVAALLAAGADLTAVSTNEQGNTPLHAACAGGSAATVRRLLAAGASTAVGDRSGHAPLHVAAAGGKVDVVGALLEAGADLRAKNREGRLPADVARDLGHDEAAEALAGP